MRIATVGASAVAGNAAYVSQPSGQRRIFTAHESDERTERHAARATHAALTSQQPLLRTFYRHSRTANMRRPVTTSMERPMTHQANGRIFGEIIQIVSPLNTIPPIGTDEEWIREEERKRIARDIHDELGQQLLVLRMDVFMLRERIVDTHPQLHAVVGDVLRQLDTTMQSVRSTIRGLRPAVLDLGLRAAAEWQCAEFTRRSKIACDLIWSAGDIAMADRSATALFRTLQESLTNVHRHARASRVCITVCIDNKNIVMTVSDNGIGKGSIDPTMPNSFGLSGMRERITALGGDLVIGSTVQGGLTLRVSLSL